MNVALSADPVLFRAQLLNVLQADAAVRQASKL